MANQSISATQHGNVITIHSKRGWLYRMPVGEPIKSRFVNSKTLKEPVVIAHRLDSGGRFIWVSTFGGVTNRERPITLERAMVYCQREVTVPRVAPADRTDRIDEILHLLRDLHRMWSAPNQARTP